jgi:hypothetical protein
MVEQYHKRAFMSVYYSISDNQGAVEYGLWLLEQSAPKKLDWKIVGLGCPDNISGHTF